jgi:hypothetical protein
MAHQHKHMMVARTATIPGAGEVRGNFFLQLKPN